MNDNTINAQDVKVLDAVKTYSDRGFLTTPVTPGQKKTPATDTTGRRVTPEEKRVNAAHAWEIAPDNANVALSLLPGLAGLDVDHYEDGTKQGWIYLRELFAEHGLNIDDYPWEEWPRSTRRGVDSAGVQFFFRVPEDLEYTTKPCTDVEMVQATHRYSMVWPSVVEGRQYRWYKGDKEMDTLPEVADLPEMPAELVPVFARGPVRSAGSRVDEESLSASLKWLEARVIGGESTTVLPDDVCRYDAMRDKVWNLVHRAVFEGHAGLMADLKEIESRRTAYEEEQYRSVSDDYARVVMSAVAAVKGKIQAGERSDFNWSDLEGLSIPDFSDLMAAAAVNAEAREVVELTDEERAEEEAILAALEEFEAFQSGVYREKQTRKIGSWRDRAMSGAWLDAQEFPELQWTVPGLIPEGYGVIVAPPKAGKSWFVANIGLAAAGGGKALGHIDVPQRPVLYLALEDGPRRLQDRYRKLTDGAPIPEALESITEASRDEALAWIEEFATEFAEQRPLIILDTLGKIMGHKSSNQSAYAHDYEEGSRLKRIAAVMPGGTLLVVHHTNKGQHDDFQDAVSGTQGIAGAADFTMHLARKRKSPQGFLSITGRDVTENEYAVTFQDNGLWTLDGGTLDAAAEAVEEARAEDKQNNLSTVQGQSLQILRKAGDEGMTATEFAAKEGISSDTARKRLNRMADDGVILKTADKRYKAPEIPRSVPLERQAPDTGSA